MSELKFAPEELPPVLECTAEFGAEVNSFVPYIHYLYQTGQMLGRKILTYRGMRAFYYFLDEDQILEKDAPRKWVSPLLRPSWLPNRDDHFPKKSSREWFPDYRIPFATNFGFKKPILAIHNKHSTAFLLPPLNYFPLERLDEIFARYKGKYQIVFLPAGGEAQRARGFSRDHQKDKFIDEASVLRRHPEVINFNDMLEDSPWDYNETKLRLYASTYVFFTVQGGNAHMCSLFRGSVVAILHRVGQETRFSYAHGHFQWAAKPAPYYLIAQTLGGFMDASRVVEDIEIRNGRVFLGPEALSLHAKYSEFRFR